MKKEKFIDWVLDEYLAILKRSLTQKLMVHYSRPPQYTKEDFDVQLKFGDDKYYFYMKVIMDGDARLYGGEYGLNGFSVKGVMK